MADVFISYAREDRPRAEMVARALSAAGIEAFWDTEIPPGQTWADYIEAKLTNCKALIVLWSEHSTKSQWVREEARLARDKHKLIPAMLDNSAVPFGFGEVQAANLTGWNGDPNSAEWMRVRKAVEATLGRYSTSAPPPTAPPPMSPPPFSPPPPMAGFVSQTGDGTSPVDYVRKCFRLYLNGLGRARRAEFWWFALAYFVASFVAAVLDLSLFGVNPYTSEPNSLLITAVVGLGLVCPMVSVSSRRFHDVGLNGWLVALGFVPYIGWLFIMVVGFIPGQPGENKYGPNPKGA